MLELWGRLQGCRSPRPGTRFSKAGHNRRLSHFLQTKKQSSRSLAHFQGTSSPKVRRAALQTVLHVFNSLSWRLCDWGYVLLNHHKKKITKQLPFGLCLHPISPRARGCCLPLPHSHWGWPQLPPHPSPFFCLFSLLKTVRFLPEKKGSSTELLVGAVTVGGSGVSQEGADELKD